MLYVERVTLLFFLFRHQGERDLPVPLKSVPLRCAFCTLLYAHVYIISYFPCYFRYLFYAMLSCAADYYHSYNLQDPGHIDTASTTSSSSFLPVPKVCFIFLQNIIPHCTIFVVLSFMLFIIAIHYLVIGIFVCFSFLLWAT